MYDEAVTAYAGARADTRRHVDALLDADPSCVLGHCLDGYLSMLSSRRSGVVEATEALERARSAIGGSAARGARERLHVEALGAWSAGDMHRAADALDSVLRDHPRDLVALKVSQFVLSYLGASARMRTTVEHAMRSWDATIPGFGFTLGCHAYALEECGDYARAEDLGRRAVTMNPADIWAAHAVAHVHEMQGVPRDGIRWISRLAPGWRECSNFALHLRWHEALYHLELGEHERVLELYDREVRSSPSDEYLDITNAVSLLWRLEQAGVGVGPRWVELATRARVLGEEHVLVFVDAHHAMALAASGDATAVERFLESCERFARETTGTEALVMREVGLPLVHAAIAHRRGSYAEAFDLLHPLRHRIQSIGGSHAQRDVFEQMLIDSAWRARRLDDATALLAARIAKRPRSVWAWKHKALVLDAAGASGAREAHEQVVDLLQEWSA
ncbi:MAG: tetratricopeptide repeat protein [Gemmatimonadota bacterium]